MSLFRIQKMLHVHFPTFLLSYFDRHHTTRRAQEIVRVVNNRCPPLLKSKSNIQYDEIVGTGH